MVFVRRGILVLVCALAFAGCRRPAADSSTAAETKKIEACELIQKEEIEAIQGSPVKDTTSSSVSDQGMRASQCFYTTTEANRSVSLMLTQADPDSPKKAKDFWEATFGRREVDEKESGRGKGQTERKKISGEEEESVPPKKIGGVGDEAFWVGSRVGGALYVLKKDTFIRISVGGPENEKARIDKSKKLAEKALERL
jgi:hypothetical protein